MGHRLRLEDGVVYEELPGHTTRKQTFEVLDQMVEVFGLVDTFEFVQTQMRANMSFEGATAHISAAAKENARWQGQWYDAHFRAYGEALAAKGRYMVQLDKEAG